jgi:citrate lyase beta subunit
MLAQVLDDFSDALALVETAQEALEATEIAGAPLATLRRGLADLRLAHKGLDLAILGVRRGVK